MKIPFLNSAKRNCDKSLIRFEIFLILLFSIIPLFTNFPYRVNIFLSWEGAYRLYMGHIPYSDFGLPMGFAYWLIPALFFKIFGPYMITLIKAQVFLNIVSAISFQQILRKLEVQYYARSLAIFLFLISFSFFNFWPWYNHSVMVYQFVGLAFLVTFLTKKKYSLINYIYLLVASLFLFLSFFTKQDAGALGFLIAIIIVFYHCIIEKRYNDILIFLAFYFCWVLLFILPFWQYDFSYWFNLGQEPHNSRISIKDFLTVFFSESKWEKFYLSGFILFAVFKWKEIPDLFRDKFFMLFFLLSLGILVEAIIFQVTSYTPPDNNIFFHSFCMAFFLHHLFHLPLKVNLWKLLISAFCILLWWSSVYWKYIDRMIDRILPSENIVDSVKVSRNNFMLKEKEESIVGLEKWIYSDLKVFKGIYMPKSTVDGMERLENLEGINYKNDKILNMTELTPLAHEFGYELEKGKPLWYHKGVGMFQREVDEYVDEIKKKKYDLVLFEYLPFLNNFYPFEVRDALLDNYQQVDEFLAPRRPTNAYIEVYRPKEK